MNHGRIELERCTGCGTCALICPDKLIEVDKSAKKAALINEHSTYCIACAQCMAICPDKAIFINDFTYEKDLYPLEKPFPAVETVEAFFETRRSIRNFKDKPVEREKLEKIAEMISMAPMGFPPHSVCLTIVSEKKTIEEALPYMIKFYEKAIFAVNNPLIRFFMKRSLTPEMFRTLKDHVVPISERGNRLWNEKKHDYIFRDAPAMILIHGERDAPCGTENQIIALTYGLLAAHSLGLGATAIGLIPPAVDKVPELRKLFKIPENHVPMEALIVGYPKVQFKHRAIKRQLAGVNWL